jgi:DNA-binding protein HU-beta
MLAIIFSKSLTIETNARGDKPMTKAEFIAAVASETGLTKTQAAKTIDTVTDTITGELKKGEKIILPGFGTFSVAKRKARTGRNPRTGEEIRIPASKAAKFTPGKALKERLK